MRLKGRMAVVLLGEITYAVIMLGWVHSARGARLSVMGQRRGRLAIGHWLIVELAWTVRRRSGSAGTVILHGRGREL